MPLTSVAAKLLAVPALLTVIGAGASAGPLQPASALLSAAPPTSASSPLTSGPALVNAPLLPLGAQPPSSAGTQSMSATPQQATSSAAIPSALAGTWLHQWGDAAGTMQSSIINKFAIDANGAYQYVEDHRDVYYARGCVDERQYYERGMSGVQGPQFLRRPSVALALHQGNCGLGANFGWTPVRLVGTWSYYQISQARAGQLQLAIIDPRNTKSFTIYNKQ
jgi:hypothetical protein